MTEKETQLNSPDNKKANTQIPVIFQSIKTYENETEDSRFLKIKIWLMHTGKNFNGSSFSKEVVNKQLHTLANTPILTFIEENEAGEQDFSDHRMVLHRTTDGGVNLKYLGSAVGTIPESHNARWETRVADDGEELEYLVIDALMWSKWDEPINIMKEKGFKNQSMELADDYSGTWDEDGVFHFDTFKFWGACLLGEGVMPAMRDSTAEIQFSKDENIQNTIESKMQEFYTLFSQEGGKEEMEKENPATPVTPVTFTLDMFTEAQFAEVVEMNRLFDNPAEATDATNVDSDNLENSDETFEMTDEANSDSTTDDSQSTENNLEDEEEAVDETIEDETTQEFALTAQQVGNQLRSVLGKEHFHDSWGSHCRKYWYADHTDTTVIFENCADNYQFYAANYAFAGDEATIQFDTAFKVKVEYVPFEGESVAFAANLERFEADKKSTKTQLDELNTYKRQREESDIKAKFEGKLSNEELTQVFTELKDSELDKVEEKLFALIGKKDFSIQKPANTNVNKVVFNVREEEEPKPYGGLFEKYQ